MGRGRAALTGVLTMLLTASLTAASSKQPMDVSVGPTVCFEPGNIRITSRVEPRRSHFMYLKNLPAGEYQVVATLLTSTGQSSVVRNAFQVMSGRQMTE
jgi:hypothetical protein